MEVCKNCMGAIMEPGKAYGYAGKVCHCLAPNYQGIGFPTMTGWVCPRCNKAHAPHISACDCKGVGTLEIKYKTPTTNEQE